MFNDNANFYPTPEELATKMLSLVDMSRVKDLLEPSAGKGDLVKAIRKSFYKFSNERDYGTSIDCIEQDERLISILKGDGARKDVVFLFAIVYGEKRQSRASADGDVVQCEGVAGHLVKDLPFARRLDDD